MKITFSSQMYIGGNVSRVFLAPAGEGDPHNAKGAQGDTPSGQEVAHDGIEEGEENLANDGEAHPGQVADLVGDLLQAYATLYDGPCIPLDLAAVLLRSCGLARWEIVYFIILNDYRIPEWTGIRITIKQLNASTTT